VSDDRLFARRTHEEMLKKLNRRAQVRGLDVDVFEPGYRPVVEEFIAQNNEIGNWQLERDRMIAYERGRADVSRGIAMASFPCRVALNRN
jgi:predicted enzyme involved in methoxymalonyl-ACP biosynthesis